MRVPPCGPVEKARERGESAWRKKKKKRRVVLVRAVL